jgi:hypothetical protein
MSHNTKVVTKLRDANMLEAACKERKIPYQRGPHKVQLWSGNTSQADFSMQLPGWRYPVALNTKTGEVTFDNYNGSWGNIEELQRIKQEYKAQVMLHEPKIEELVAEGWQTERLIAKNGDVNVRVYKD